MADMSFLNSLSERWETSRVTQQQMIQGKYFLSSSFAAYIDIGDTVTIKYSIDVVHYIRSKVGIIFDTDL